MYHLIGFLVFLEKPKGLALESLGVNGGQGYVTASEQDVSGRMK